MKNSILRYGLAGASILIGVNVLILLIQGVPGPEDYALGEIIGYATIVVALVPVFFGIRYYRDQVSGGALSYWRGVGVGLAVATVPAAAFAVYNFVYVEIIDPEFSRKYIEYALESAREDMPAAAFREYAAELEAQTAMMTDPLVMTAVMFFTVFLIGLVIALISALILSRTGWESKA